MKKLLDVLGTVFIIISVSINLSYGGENYLAGTNAGMSLLSKATDNTMVGDYTGVSLLRGKGNVYLGMYAGQKGYGTSGTVKLGYMAGASDSSSHKLFLTTGFYPASGLFGDFSTGYFGINTASPSYNLQVTGTGYFSGALTLAGGISTTDRIVTSDTLMVSVERTPAGADSSWYMTTASGNPFMGFRATDGDLSNITVNTADQLLFQGATGGYGFDNELISIGTIDVKSSLTSDATDSTLILSLSSGNPVISFFATDDDTYTQSINTSDQALFDGASGGYVFDSTLRVKPASPAPVSDSLFVLRSSLGKTVAFFDSLGNFNNRDAVGAITTSNINGASNGTMSIGIYKTLIPNSAANPSFTNYYDPDTGMYSLGNYTNRLGFSAKGTNIAVFDSSGIQERGKLEVRGGVVPLTDSLQVWRSSLGKTVAWMDTLGGFSLAGSASKGINFTGMTPPLSDADDALLSFGTWNDEVDIGTQTAHFVPIQVHMHSTTSAPYDIAAARFRVDTDGANTANAVQVMQIRSSISDDVASAGAFGAGMSIDGAMEVKTGEMVVGGFSMAGAYKPTSATNPVTILQACNWNTYAGTSVTQIADFYQNGAGNTVDDILRLNVIAGTATDGLHVANTSGTMTNGIKLSGTIGTDLTLQNSETIDNTIDGTIKVGGKLATTGTVTGLQPVHNITAAADTFYAVTTPYTAAATPCITGTMFMALPIAQKSTLFLESAVTGAWLDVMVADADTLRIVAASGDSLISSSGVASRSIGSVAGTIRIIAVDATRWIMLHTLGTWTADDGVL